MLLVQKVQPVNGYAHIWHFEDEFKKYIDLHYRQTEGEEHIEHPYIISEHNRHWVGVVPVT